jgi:heme-degrading monooxygenase HmoA
MTAISEGQDLVTLINVFTVAPEDQQRLVDILVEATEAVIDKLPGFISANIHRSHDGTRVVNYAQWRRREDFEAMLKNPAAIPHLQQAAQLATFEPHLYEVVYVGEATGAGDGPS